MLDHDIKELLMTSDPTSTSSTTTYSIKPLRVQTVKMLNKTLASEQVIQMTVQYRMILTQNEVLEHNASCKKHLFKAMEHIREDILRYILYEVLNDR